MTFFARISDSATHGAVGSSEPYCITLYPGYDENGLPGESGQAVVAKCIEKIKRGHEDTLLASKPFEYLLFPPLPVTVGGPSTDFSWLIKYSKSPSLHTVYP